MLLLRTTWIVQLSSAQLELTLLHQRLTLRTGGKCVLQQKQEQPLTHDRSLGYRPHDRLSGYHEMWPEDTAATASLVRAVRGAADAGDPWAAWAMAVMRPQLPCASSDVLTHTSCACAHVCVPAVLRWKHLSTHKLGVCCMSAPVALLAWRRRRSFIVAGNRARPLRSHRWTYPCSGWARWVAPAVNEFIRRRSGGERVAAKGSGLRR